MERTEVKSEVFKSVGYSVNTQTLELEFRSGGVYRFFEVPPAQAEAFVKAESMGRYFREVITGRYRSEKLAPQEKANERKGNAGGPRDAKAQE